jgi:ribosomal protein S12 methylthiotransferase
MKRPAAAEGTLDRLREWRRVCPDLVLRSTFIVGFPGETEAEFEELLAWLDEAQLDRVGAFKYSPVEGARANDAGAHVDPAIQEERLARFMERAQRISATRLAARVGREETVLVDSIEDGMAIARSRGDAPEIDGVVRVKKGAKLAVGEFARVKITDADAYDLTAVVVKEKSKK